MLTTVYLVALPVLPLVAAFVILRRRNRMDPTERAPFVIYLTQLVGATTAAWSVLAAVVVAPGIFGHRSAVHADAAVIPFMPWNLAGLPAWEYDDPWVMVADIDSVRIGVAGADIATRLLQAAGSIVTAIPTIVIGVFVVILCERIIRRTPFAARLVQLSWIGAATFLVTGFAGQFLSSYASFRLANTAFGVIGAEHPNLKLPTPVWPGELAFWPLWGALALGVLAVLIRHGLRLQKDTEGLV